MLNLANQISVTRLLAATACLALLSQYSILQPQQAVIISALVLFALAAVSDWLDGYVARRRGQVTALGWLLDRFVDKVLVCGAFFIYIGPGFADAEGTNVSGLAPWMVVIVIASEFLVGGLGSLQDKQVRQPNTDAIEKAKVATQMVCAAWIMLFVALGLHDSAGNAVLLAHAAVIWITIGVSVVYGLSYLLGSWRAFTARSSASDQAEWKN